MDRNDSDIFEGWLGRGVGESGLQPLRTGVKQARGAEEGGSFACSSCGGGCGVLYEVLHGSHRTYGTNRTHRTKRSDRTCGTERRSYGTHGSDGCYGLCGSYRPDRRYGYYGCHRRNGSHGCNRYNRRHGTQRGDRFHWRTPLAADYRRKYISERPRIV